MAASTGEFRMANPSTAHEPSMEEILASIRQIISEDGDGPAAAEPPVTASAAAEEEPEPAEPEPDPEPVEMQAVQTAQPDPAPEASRRSPPAEQPAASAPAAYPGPSQVSQPALAEPQYAAPRYAEPPRPRPETQVRVATPAPQPVSSHNGPLLSAGSDAAVSGAFSALAHTILAQNARTLEDLVTEMLRPMLQGWLDENLPALVERLVKEEIDRVSRGRR